MTPASTSDTTGKPRLGRPRLKIANRPEECPRGHKGGLDLALERVVPVEHEADLEGDLGVKLGDGDRVGRQRAVTAGA